MKVVAFADIQYHDGASRRVSLFKVERKVYRWITEVGEPVEDMADYIGPESAIAAIRVAADTSEKVKDLTIHPVAPPAEERAAERILQALKMTRTDTYPQYLDKFTEIISNETGIEKLVRAVNEYLTYKMGLDNMTGMPRLRLPKMPGLDLIEAAAITQVLEALEIVQKTDLSNLKKTLTEGLEAVKVYKEMPPTKQ